MFQAVSNGEIVHGSKGVTSSAAQLVAAQTGGWTAPRSPCGVYLHVPEGDTAYWGGPGVTKDTGIPISEANGGVFVPVDDPSKIWVVAETTATVRYAYVGSE